MWRTAALTGAVLLSLLAIAVTVPGVQGQQTEAVASSSAYDLSWWTVDGGGVITEVGSETHSYTLRGTIGQPDAATWAASDGYVLVGGFWGGWGGWSGWSGTCVYLPLILRGF